MSEIERAVIATLAWFGLSHQPVAAFECWHYLWRGQPGRLTTPSEVEQALADLRAQGVVRQTGGFWQLADSASHLAERRQRARWSIAKRRRAVRGARLVSRIPFVRFVGLVNTVAYEMPSRRSDIDLFIVVLAGRLWLTRALATLLVHAAGWRRHGGKVQDRLCLSFLVTERGQDMSRLKLEHDPYLTYWTAGVWPLYGGEAYQRFLLANDWAAGYLPNRFAVTVPYARLPEQRRFAKRGLERLLSGRMGQWLEWIFRSLQLRRHRRHANSRLWLPGTAVVVSDDVMKFHETDQREPLAQAFRNRLQQLGIG